MKKVSKSVFFIIALAIAVMGYFTVVGLDTTYGDVTTRTIKGVNDVRWGIDVRGGVDVTFSPPEGIDATDVEMNAAQSVIGVRLIAQNITDYELYTDYQNDRIIVRFPLKADDTDFNPETAIKELGETAHLTFREQANQDPITKKPVGTTLDKIVIEGLDIENASANYYKDSETGA
ncbi:MAG: protein translocase subunit SecD, partial [Oscillospiraceae bacterium]